MNLTAIISLNQIKQNIAEIRLQTLKKMFLVVKANAYGLGLSVVVQNLQNYVDAFAVATIDEALQTRQNTTKPILMLQPCENYFDLIFNNIDITITSVEQLRKLICCAQTLNQNANIHIKVNTGMNRFGVKNLDEFNKMLAIARACKCVKLVAVYSHFFTENQDVCNLQINAFLPFKNCAKKLFANVDFHIEASGALNFNYNGFDAIRVGKEAYGVCAGKQSLTIASFVTSVFDVAKGESIGYNASYICAEPKKIATVFGGYADGIDKRLKNFAVCINGKPCKICGEICMDTFMVDVTNTPTYIGDSVIITDSILPLERLAHHCNTISYELITGFKGRYNNYYIGVL
ncbi:MAG: alanine racemase [Clostridia bacterium]